MSSPQHQPKQQRPEGLQSAVATVDLSTIPDIAAKMPAVRPPSTHIPGPSEPPRRGTAYLNIATKLQLSGTPFTAADKYTGDVEFFPGTCIPAGVWVDVKPEQRVHKANVDRHWLPVSACSCITLKKDVG
jgi:hypothetical protein